MRVTVANRGPEAAALHVLPTLWFRNTWDWDAGAPRPRLSASGAAGAGGLIAAEHPTLGRYRLVAEGAPDLLFVENETNVPRIFGGPGSTALPEGRDQRLRGPRARRCGESRRAWAPRPPPTTT